MTLFEQTRLTRELSRSHRVESARVRSEAESTRAFSAATRAECRIVRWSSPRGLLRFQRTGIDVELAAVA